MRARTTPQTIYVPGKTKQMKSVARKRIVARSNGYSKLSGLSHHNRHSYVVVRPSAIRRLSCGCPPLSVVPPAVVHRPSSVVHRAPSVVRTPTAVCRLASVRRSTLRRPSSHVFFPTFHNCKMLRSVDKRNPAPPETMCRPLLGNMDCDRVVDRPPCPPPFNVAFGDVVQDLCDWAPSLI